MEPLRTRPPRARQDAPLPVAVRLKPGEEDRLLAGHPWIYRNEVEGWPPSAEPGDLVDVFDGRKRFLGRGYLNPRSTIAIRLFGRDRSPIDEGFFANRIRQAQAWREKVLGGRSAYRVVHAEADGLPGLIVDRYGDALVLQILTAGMDRRRDLIVNALQEILAPRIIVARNDSPMREREGLPRERGVPFGALPPELVVQVNGLDVAVDLLEGQKTGLFLDQIENYRLLERLAEGAEALDCFCYTGLWGLHAARYGAARVTGLDQSAPAIERATALAERNGLAGRCTYRVGNVFDELKERDRRRESFDLVILDPPAFVKTRARLPEAVAGYKEINLRAMRLLRPGGCLITCSCSHHLTADRFRQILQEAAGDVRRTVRLVAQGAQGHDHPVLLGMPESEYLKCFVLQVL
ncbi:MAG: class I SAM-dependent rRNA methyltransferase [Nitrospirae bacterium]|nr:MAG: class I SAM-dependent rRNA methyltransferase [Nitrospirota bacterium]